MNVEFNGLTEKRMNMGHQRSPIVRSLWTVFVLLLFAVWWGGLTFYAAIVVPIGTELIGASEQGFVTQQVTQWHNAVLTAMSVCLVIEAWRQRRWQLWTVVCGLAVIDAALLHQHQELSGLISFQDQSISDGFYSQHAIYLWLTTIEWAIGLTIPFLVSSGSEEVCST